MLELKKIIPLVITLLVVISSNAQDLSIHMMDSIYARTEVNPAYRFDKKVVINLPGLSGGSYTNGISIDDILIENGGLNQFQLKEGISNINASNYITGEFNTNLVGLGITFGKWQLSAGYNWHLVGATNYTEDLYLLAANGNAPYIGETLVKLLSGTEDLSTERSKVEITTDEEIYQLTVDADYVLNTTGLVNYDGIDNVDVNGDTSGESKTFEGVDILDFIDDDQEVILEDSLYNLLDFEESNNDYSTSLGPKFHISARYDVSKKVTLGANYYLAKNHIADRYLASMNVQYRIANWVSMGSGLATSSNSSVLIPANLLLHVGPVTAFVSSDNIISAFSITSSKVSQLRLGVQLGF